MALRNWLGSLAVLTGMCVAAGPALAWQQQQQSSDPSQQQGGDPVADAARKAREQQKAAPKPKKVYTDDDVKPAKPAQEAPASSATASAEPQQAAEGTDAKAAGTAKDGKEDPATSWKKRFAEQRAKIAAAEKELDILQREEQKAEIQYYPDPQKALEQQYTRQDINDKLAKIDAKKQDVVNLKQQLDDLEDELRKSGGDPGWAREQ